MEQEKKEKMRLEKKLLELEEANKLQEVFMLDLEKKNAALEQHVLNDKSAPGSFLLS